MFYRPTKLGEISGPETMGRRTYDIAMLITTNQWKFANSTAFGHLCVDAALPFLSASR